MWPWQHHTALTPCRERAAPDACSARDEDEMPMFCDLREGRCREDMYQVHLHSVQLQLVPANAVAVQPEVQSQGWHSLSWHGQCPGMQYG